MIPAAREAYRLDAFTLLTPKVKFWSTVRYPVLQSAAAAAEALRRAPQVHVYAHIDPDGITSGSIAMGALGRAGIEAKISFLKKLSPEAIEKIKDENPPLAWFTDFGSGMFPRLEGLSALVTDHHVPAPIPAAKRMDMVELGRYGHDLIHLNPHLHGFDGGVDISSAGLAYMVARAMDIANQGLVPLVAVGALGDRQDHVHGQLVGPNADLIAEGCGLGLIEKRTDVRFFGRETRPLHRLLQYANDPRLPRLSGDEEACIVFFLELGIDLKDGEEWRTWPDLQEFERRRVLSELVTLLLEGGYGHQTAQRLLGEIYLLAKEKPRTPFRDAKEYATLLNACGRYDHPDLGMRLCLGDRGKAFEEAKELLKGHRMHLVESMDYIEREGIIDLGAIQYYHGKDRIRDTVIGVTAGMMMGSEGVAKDKPLLALAFSDDGVKVSARGPDGLRERGLDLAKIMKEAAEAVGGFGGGHGAAAGATIPRGSEEEFLRRVNVLVGAQLGTP